MPGKKSAAVFLLALLPLFLGFSSSEENHASPFLDILGKTINFLLLFGGLGFLLAKPLRKFLADAGLAVAQTIRKTEKAKRNAERKLEALQARMEGLESEVEKIRQAGREAGGNEKDRLLAQARQEGDRVKSLAEMEIEAHAQAARAELREYAAGLAVALAETRINQRLTPEIHSRLIDRSIRKLDELYEKAHSG